MGQWAENKTKEQKKKEEKEEKEEDEDEDEDKDEDEDEDEEESLLNELASNILDETDSESKNVEQVRQIFSP